MLCVVRKNQKTQLEIKKADGSGAVIADGICEDKIQVYSVLICLNRLIKSEPKILLF